MFDYRIAIKFNINHSVTEEETEGVDKVALRSIDIGRDDGVSKRSLIVGLAAFSYLPHVVVCKIIIISFHR